MPEQSPKGKYLLASYELQGFLSMEFSFAREALKQAGIPRPGELSAPYRPNSLSERVKSSRGLVEQEIYLAWSEKWDMLPPGIQKFCRKCTQLPERAY